MYRTGGGQTVGQRQPRSQHGTGERELRADARRNITAILDAALECLARDPQASIADIAKAAGVGRVTLYGHFSSRAELVDAAFGRGLRQAGEILSAVDLTGDPRDALIRLVTSSWQMIDRHRALLAAAERELPAERIRAYHDEPMARVLGLIERGRSDGSFRADLDVEWLVSLFYTVMHGAAAEISAGCLRPDDAARLITATLLAAYTPPGQTVPAPGSAASGEGNERR
jgi:AcrR family transcriptional regulator